MRAVILLMLIVMLACPALAQDAEPIQVETHVQSVALFKNGIGFFSRAGELPQAPVLIETGPLPAAVHGSLWLGWGEGVQFANLRAREVVATDTRDALSIPEMIRANIGRRVQVWPENDDVSLTGRILAAPEQPWRDPITPYLAIRPLERQPDSANLVLVQTDAGETLALQINRIHRIIFLEQPVTEVPIDAKHVALAGDLTAGTAGTPLMVSYLARGMTWAPSYLVDISDDEEAILTAKAAIINEIEDLDGARVELVTGFPYVEYAAIISPLAQKETLAAFLNALRRGASAGMPADPGVLAQMRAPAPARERVEFVVAPDYGAPAEALGVEDLFFYPIEDVTLARGETGYLPLFSQPIPYEHVYTWEVADRVDPQARHRPVTEAVDQIVWHSLRLENEMAMPWTTAPAQTVSGGRILGQSTLNYTPRGGETLLRITQAMEIDAEEMEVETARVPNAATFAGVRHDRITVSGTLTMRSHLDRDVTVEVIKRLTGEVQTTTPPAEIVRLAERLQRANPRSQLTWELPLAAGETVEMTYIYEVYVRN